MGIYKRIIKLYEEAEQEAAAERARQQREAELLRAASKVADALHAQGVEAADAPIRGWLIHRQRVPPVPPSPPPEPGQGFTALRTYISRSTTVEHHLGVDGRIYRDGKPIDHPTNATIDEIEQYLAEIVVKNRLDPEPFKDAGTES